MGLKRTDEFRQDAVRIALTSGLTRKQVAADLGIGMSTLNKWITAHRDTDVVSKEDLWLAQENEQLRREVCILKEERDILEKQRSSSRAKSREVQVRPLPGSALKMHERGRTPGCVSGSAPVSGYGCQHARFACVPQSVSQPQTAI